MFLPRKAYKELNRGRYAESLPRAYCASHEKLAMSEEMDNAYGTSDKLLRLK
jgi:hypothetical protein